MIQKSIRVQGKGSVSQAPERIRIVFTINFVDPDFGKAVEGCNLGIDAIRSAAGSCGIAPGELKSMHFDVGEETKYSSGRHKHFGFRSTHQLGIALPIDRELIGHFLSAVLGGKAKPEVDLAFEVSDPEELKQKVLANAVENAKRRAETIATASGIKLGSISHIEYGCADVRISSRPRGRLSDPAGPSISAPKIEPEDVKAEDSVTITWDIE